MGSVLSSPKSAMGSVFYSRSSSLGSNGTRKSSNQSGQLTGASKTENVEVLASPTASLSSKSFGNRIMGSYPRKYSSLKMVFPSTDEYKTEKAEAKKPIDDTVTVKTLHVIDASTENKRLETVKSDGSVHIPPSTTPFPQPAEPVDHNVQGKTLPIVEAATESKPVPTDDNIEDNVQVKTLHVVEPANENKTLGHVKTDAVHQNSLSTPDFQSPESLPSHTDEVKEYPDVKDVEHLDDSDGEDYEDSEYTDTNDSDESEYAESETDEFISENNDVVDKPKDNHKRSSRKGREITSEDKDSALTKSKFRRGRIVDLQNEEDVPRKLKFRRGRVVENEDGSKTYVRKRRFKKREVADDANEANADSEQVVLRHQEQQEKIDQGLLNNVIEETATKLADERKSKVKALVGAFETVMSQES